MFLHNKRQNKLEAKFNKAQNKAQKSLTGLKKITCLWVEIPLEKIDGMDRIKCPPASEWWPTYYSSLQL